MLKTALNSHRSLFRNMYFSRKKQPGASLLLGVILIAVIATFALGVASLVINSIRQSNNVKQANVAYYAAEGALERGLLKNKDLGVGGSFTEKTQVGTNGATSQYQIKGQTNTYGDGTLNGKYTIPGPWTGNAPWHGDGALSGGGCDALKYPPLINNGTQFIYPKQGAPGNQITVDAIEHPCNWGKIALGEKITIPLFGYNLQNCSNGNCTPVNMSDFSIRLRTPCSNGEEYCLGSERAKLDSLNGGEIPCIAISKSNCGEVVVLWQIEAKDASQSNKVVVMEPNQNEAIDLGNYYPDDTQIFEGKINGKLNSQSYEVLKVNSGSTLKGKVDGLQTLIKQILANNYHEPVLKLSVVGGLNECVQNGCAGNNENFIKKIPYLEYQIQFESSNPIAPSNVQQIVTAQGSSGAFNQTIEVKVPQDSSGLEYVIQQ